MVFKPAAYLLPSPLAILRAANIDSRQLINATLSTAISAGLGFVIAAVVGMVCASVLSQSQFLQRGLYPLASLFQMVPLVAIAPLLVIWLGYGLSATVASAAIVAVFPVLANTLDGLRSTDPALRELFRIYKANRFTRWWKLELPSATPNIVTAWRPCLQLFLKCVACCCSMYIKVFEESRNAAHASHAHTVTSAKA